MTKDSALGGVTPCSNRHLGTAVAHVEPETRHIPFKALSQRVFGLELRPSSGLALISLDFPVTELGRQLSFPQDVIHSYLAKDYVPCRAENQRPKIQLCSKVGHGDLVIHQGDSL